MIHYIEITIVVPTALRPEKDSNPHINAVEERCLVRFGYRGIDTNLTKFVIVCFLFILCELI